MSADDLSIAEGARRVERATREGGTADLRADHFYPGCPREDCPNDGQVTKLRPAGARHVSRRCRCLACGRRFDPATNWWVERITAINGDGSEP